VIHASKVDDIYRETQALKKLNHPSIVKLYNAFLKDHYVVLIMEYIAGGELYKYVKDKGGLSEIEARKFFSQLTDAVEYCHNQFIIHRDLKPTNILLTDTTKEQIKLIDFGISGSNQGKDNSTAGSLAYMPPEVLTNSNTSADPAIDVWAMGIILYFMLYGFLPFRGTTEKEVVKAITTSKVVFPPGKKKLTNECTKLITEMLVKNPINRIKVNEIMQSDWLKLPDEKLMDQKPTEKKTEPLKMIHLKDEELKKVAPISPRIKLIGSNQKGRSQVLSPTLLPRKIVKQSSDKQVTGRKSSSIIKGSPKKNLTIMKPAISKEIKK